MRRKLKQATDRNSMVAVAKITQPMDESSMFVKWGQFDYRK